MPTDSYTDHPRAPAAVRQVRSGVTPRTRMISVCTRSGRDIIFPDDWLHLIGQFAWDMRDCGRRDCIYITHLERTPVDGAGDSLHLNMQTATTIQCNHSG